MGKQDVMAGKLSVPCSTSYQELSPPATQLHALPAGEKEVSRYVIQVEKHWEVCKMCCDSLTLLLLSFALWELQHEEDDEVILGDGLSRGTVRGSKAAGKFCLMML